MFIYIFLHLLDTLGNRSLIASLLSYDVLTLFLSVMRELIMCFEENSQKKIENNTYRCDQFMQCISASAVQ